MIRFTYLSKIYMNYDGMTLKQRVCFWGLWPIAFARFIGLLVKDIVKNALS